MPERLILLIPAVIMSVSAAQAEYPLVNLQTSELTVSALNKTYTDGTSGTSSVKIVGGNLTDAPEDAESPCFGTGGVYFGNYGTSGYSYITIDNLGSDNITAVELQGFCGGRTGYSSTVWVAFSGKSSSDTKDPEYSDNLDFNVGGQVFLDAEQEGCTEHEVRVPDASDTYSQEQITFVKSVKIALTTRFGGEGIDPQYPVTLQRLTVYTEGEPTGIGVAGTEDAFSCYVSGGVLTFTETAAEVSVYDLLGTMIKTAENVRDLPLNTLPGNNVYLVRAVSLEGRTLTTKIMR
jgi:hypothetical protein